MVALVGGVVPAAAATPECLGKKATLVGTNGPETLEGSPGNDVIFALSGDDEIFGNGGEDRICGGPGADYIDGGSATDRIRGDGGADTLVGRRGHDVLSGLGGHDFLAGMQGNDTYSGGAGFDFGVFAFASGPVSVDLQAAAALGEGSDTLQGIDDILGSDYGDILRGDGNTNLMAGGLGNDTLIGRGGNDLAFYILAPASVTVNLTHGNSSGGDGGDSLSSIEDAIGSDYDDTLIGNPGANYLIGWDGQDTIDGQDGDDVCVGETLLNCPAPPASPTTQPPAGSGPPPPPAQASALSEAATEVAAEQGERSSDGIQIEKVEDLREMTSTMMATWNDYGFHSCWGGQSTAFRPIVSGNGWLAWRPVFVYWSPSTGYKYFYGYWAQQWQHTGLMNPQFLALQGYPDSWVAVYNHIYDYSTGEYSGNWSPWFHRNPVFGYQNSGQIWCPEGRET
jgi:Ca2+-binding RTX toxin-like protein